MRDRLTFAIVALVLFFVLFYIAPLDVLLLNAAEIEVSPLRVVGMTWQLQAAFLVVVVLLLLRVPGRVLRGLGCVLLGLILVIYLQGNFFVWEYGPLDGTDIDWQAFNAAGVFEIVAWIGLPLVALFLQHRLWPHVRTLALILVLLHASSMGILLAGGKLFPGAPALMKRQIDERFFEFSADRNILLIVVDTFAQPLFSDIVKQHPELVQRLDGFISFDDTLGTSPYTLLSIPVILSSNVYENAGTIQAYMGDALGPRSLPALLQNEGYRADIATLGTYRDYLAWLPGRDFTTVLYDGGRDVETESVLQAWDLTLFRFAPHFLKQRIYDHHRWLLQSRFLGPKERSGEGRLMEATPMQEASKIIVERLSGQASLGSESPTFKFIHLFTSHPPFLIRADGELMAEAVYSATPVTQRAIDQGVYAVEQVLEILGRLEALGIYDETLVIVAADHGTDITKSTRPVYKRRAHPMLLVKPFEARGPLQNSRQPASLRDIPATIGAGVDLDAGFSGYDLLAGNIPADRVRHYYYFNWEGKEFWNIDQLPFLHKFRVNGPVPLLESWRKVCNLQPVDAGDAACPE